MNEKNNSKEPQRAECSFNKLTEKKETTMGVTPDLQVRDA